MSRKAKLKKTLVEQILDKAGLAHEPIAVDLLTPEERAILNQDQIFKTLALMGDKKVAMIAQKDLQKTTGYVHGANNPVGIRQKHAFPIFIDQTALELGDMIVSAGEVDRSIKIDAQTLATFVGATIADLKED